MNILENETRDIFGKIPAIIYIYKAEALESGHKKEESQKYRCARIKRISRFCSP
jgi:hypothetical protein